MPASRLVRSIALAAALALGALASHAQAADAWKFTEEKDGSGSLTLVKSAGLLGKPGAVHVSFSSGRDNPRENTFGALSITLTVDNPVAYPQFHFDDFEGPDSAIGKKKLMKFRILANGKATSVDVSPAGSYLALDGKTQFTFEASEFISKRQSPERKVFDALSAGADELEITVTDSRDARTALTVKVPVAGEKEHFKAMLKGVK